jgi:large subunit ribosomal protein L18
MFLSPRISNKNTNIHISKATITGDQVLASINSRSLSKIGWKGSGKCIPAGYLSGLLIGLKAKNQGIENAILYTGLRSYIHRSRISAIVKGVLDSGVSISSDVKTFPNDDRIRGDHISKYAKSLLKDDKKLYTKRFSKYIERGLNPEDIPKHFIEIREKIMQSYGGK